MSQAQTDTNNQAGSNNGSPVQNQGSEEKPYQGKSNVKPDPTVMIVFGGTGDLADRKLAPAFFNLFVDGMLPSNFEFIGLGRTEYTDVNYRKHLGDGVDQFSRRKPAPGQWDNFATCISYFKSDISNLDSYKELGVKLDAIDKKWGIRANRIFYLSVSPRFIEPVTQNLSAAGLTSDPQHDRIIIEKPFGHDLDSARELNTLLAKNFRESQIYRIDHYLGKETVQNILALRFANTLFEPLWNRNYVDCVKITVSEQVGVENRGDYYDGAGAFRDMIQNHLLQLLCMVAMEPPISFDADEIRSKKVDVLRAIRPFKPEDVKKHVIRAQYGPGMVKGKEAKGYIQEDKVNPKSTTETYAAVKLYVDNWRWQDVPFYLQTGKQLKDKESMITVQYHPVPHLPFPKEVAENMQANQLLIHIQPEMDIVYKFQAKAPGLKMLINPVQMVFDYEAQGTGQPPEAYETLLLDVMLGDATLFMRVDQVEAAWAAVMPILNAWAADTITTLPTYPAGSSIEDVAKILIQQGDNLKDMVALEDDREAQMRV